MEGFEPHVWGLVALAPIAGGAGKIWVLERHLCRWGAPEETRQDEEELLGREVPSPGSRKLVRMVGSPGAEPHLGGPRGYMLPSDPFLSKLQR